MSLGKKSPAWFSSFKEWFQQPSPTGEWLFRGQSSQYPSIIPSLLRSGNKDFYGDKLYNVDYSVAARILDASPVLRHGNPYGAIWSDSDLDVREITRALAQHYDYPTLFVDLTREPLVAAFFATHSFSNGQYHVRDDNPGIVYRWPAARKGPARLFISSPELDQKVHRNIPVIDLSVVNKQFRRPHSQRAVLAKPVEDPAPIYVPRSISTPPEELMVVDMAGLSSCEKFILPPEAGHDLLQVSGVSSDALFPDQIDLGYSYVAIIALLSLIIHEPNVSKADVMRQHYNEGIFAGSTILEHECFRLIPGYRPTHKHYTLADASTIIMMSTEMARDAIRLLDSEEVQDAGKEWRQTKLIEVTRRLNIQYEAFKSALINFRRDDGSRLHVTDEPLDFNLFWVDRGKEWMMVELDRRYGRTKDIIANAEKAPVYALQDKDKYNSLLNIFPIDQRYEEWVMRQINSYRLWMKDSPIFMSFE